MLENAGAVIFSARERDCQPYNIIIDNDASSSDCGLSVEEKGRKAQWETHTPGFATPQEVLFHGDNPFTHGTSHTMHTATNDKSSESAA